MSRRSLNPKWSTVDVQVDGSACTVILNRPSARNALNGPLLGDLGEALEWGAAQEAVRVLILVGSDCGAFSVGGDLKEISSADTGLGHTVVPDTALFDVLDSCAKPLIAAIDGHCLGGGLEIALACDIRVATMRSTFGLPEPRAGMVAEFGLDLLSRMIPFGEAMMLQLTGSRMDAPRAHQIGLVQRLAASRAELFECTRNIAEEIIACEPVAVLTIKRVLKSGRELPLGAARIVSAPLRDEIHRSEQAWDGARAFAEGRLPTWQLPQI